MTATSTCPASPSVEGVRLISLDTAKVVDLALELIDCDFGDDDYEGVPSLALDSTRDSVDEHSSSSHLPLQLVTPSPADDDDDDSSSVSTISGGEEADNSSRRSIFKPYWDKSGVKPSPEQQAVPISVSIPKNCNEKLPTRDSSYERTSVVAEPKKEDDARRKIFGRGSWSRSEPVLSLSYLAPQISSTFSKAHRSTSSLEEGTTRKGSCLRRGKFSGRSSSRRESDASSDTSIVTFSQDVSVFVFPKSAERWAQTGWSKWFA